MVSTLLKLLSQALPHLSQRANIDRDCSGHVGQKWFGQSLLVQSDIIATVAMVNSGVSHNSETMHLLRCLAFIVAKFQLSFAAAHILGEKTL